MVIQVKQMFLNQRKGFAGKTYKNSKRDSMVYTKI